MRQSKAALAGHTCGDCGHGRNERLQLFRMDDPRPYRHCSLAPEYAGVIAVESIHQPGDAACSRWKAEKGGKA